MSMEVHHDCHVKNTNKKLYLPNEYPVIDPAIALVLHSSIVMKIETKAGTSAQPSPSKSNLDVSNIEQEEAFDDEDDEYL